MTDDDAEKVASVAIQADGGCSSCVRGQLEELHKLFPEFDWLELALEAYLADNMGDPAPDLDYYRDSWDWRT